MTDEIYLQKIGDDVIKIGRTTRSFNKRGNEHARATGGEIRTINAYTSPLYSGIELENKILKDIKSKGIEPIKGTREFFTIKDEQKIKNSFSKVKKNANNDTKEIIKNSSQKIDKPKSKPKAKK